MIIEEQDLIRTDIRYKEWLEQIKCQIRQARYKTMLAANISMVSFYWELGKELYYKQQDANFGSKLFDVLSADLRKEFENVTGFSRTNLYNCVKFYAFYRSLVLPNETDFEFVQRSVGQLPWRHNILLITQLAKPQEAIYYIDECVKNGWTKDVLAIQIKSNLAERQGKVVCNFTKTLSPSKLELAQQTFKDPYLFDFIDIKDDFTERDIELQLTNHMTKLLLELGRGFSFMGRQYKIILNCKEYFIDLLFYHVILKCYVVVELKNKEFEPEFTGKLNFYINAVDEVLKTSSDNQTIGILLCRSKDDYEVEISLRGMQMPMGVSEFVLSEEIKSSLPTIEEIEAQIKKE